MKGVFYKAFDPETALQRAGETGFHFTPRHGSWLNITEIELPVLSRNALKRDWARYG